MSERKLPEVSFLILDYIKPKEAETALRSIRQNAQFNYELVFLSNGGEQDYVYEFYKEGLIDRLILNKVNNGLGYGTEDLFRFCETDYAIYFQNDQILAGKIGEEEIQYYIDYLKNNPTVGAIGLAGYPCGPNKYSERAHLINVKFYNSIPKTHGGCGPYNHLKYNEQCVQEFFKENNYKFIATNTPRVLDNGVFTVRELPCGGVVKMRTDTKQVWWLSPPLKSYMFPEMHEDEWELSIAGKWKDGDIPRKYSEQNLVFNCWGDQV